MWTDKGTLVTITCSVVGLSLGAVLFVIPECRRASELNAEVQSIEARIENSSQEIDSLRDLADSLKRVQRDYERQREIPSAPSMAELMAALTVPADGVTVIAQEFTAGSPMPVEQVPDGSVLALPLSVNTSATFEAIYELLETAQKLPRLVRVASVQLERDTEKEGVIDATIELQAIFEPNSSEIP